MGNMYTSKKNSRWGCGYKYSMLVVKGKYKKISEQGTLYFSNITNKSRRGEMHEMRNTFIKGDVWSKSRSDPGEKKKR